MSAYLYTLAKHDLAQPPGWPTDTGPPDPDSLPGGTIPNDTADEEGVGWPLKGTLRKDNCSKEVSGYLWSKVQNL